MSCSMAERTFVDSFILFVILMATIIQPVASSWILGDGWLKVIGIHDAAGAGYVHMVGGICGFMGTWVLGPRIGMFEQSNVSKFVKAVNIKKRILNSKNDKTQAKLIKKGNVEQNTQSSNSDNNVTVPGVNFTDHLRFMKDSRDVKNFYNFDEETPMKFRVYLFRQQFKEFSSLKIDQCQRLIRLYDSNLRKSHKINSPQFSLIGSLFLYVGWLMFNASSVLYQLVKQDSTTDFSNPLKTPQHAVMVSILSSAMSALVAYLLFNLFQREMST